MKKVKLTREQAEAVEALKSSSLGNDGTILEFVRACGISNHVFHLDELIKALYIGYEVEETFKVGDWVVTTDGMVAEIIDVCMFHKDSVALYGVDGRHAFDTLRHATPEEIAEEKHRRWWAKHGREVWELREDDILKYLNDLYIVDCFDSEKVCLKSGVERKTNYAEPFDFVKRHFKVVCFAEDRKDVQA